MDSYLDESSECSVSCAVLENITWADWSTCFYDEDVAVFRFHYVDWTVNEPDWQSLLHPDEIQRALRYRREEDRYRSLYTRSLLRILVGKYINQPPSAIQFTVGITKKPVLQDSTDWHFNVAHSGAWILLAISKVSVGVDVEEVLLNFSYRDVVAYSFSASERQYIEAAGQTQLRFYQL